MDTAVWGCGCMLGLTVWRSLQWVPLCCTIMTCQKRRPLKTGIIHRSYLTKWILTGATACPLRPLNSIIYSTGLLSNLTRKKRSATKIEHPDWRRKISSFGTKTMTLLHLLIMLGFWLCLDSSILFFFLTIPPFSNQKIIFFFWWKASQAGPGCVHPPDILYTCWGPCFISDAVCC